MAVKVACGQALVEHRIVGNLFVFLVGHSGKEMTSEMSQASPPQDGAQGKAISNNLADELRR